MEIKQIIFPEKNKAELITITQEMGDDEICVKSAFTTVSCGTEKANITGEEAVAGASTEHIPFPRSSGYNCSGTVVAKGKNVTTVDIGDRVVLYWSKHKDYNIMNENNAIKIEDDNVSFEEAALSFIATFPLAAIRKTRLEIGESCLVMGLGLLGQLAVKLARVAGATPIIAVDPVAERRDTALKNGADYAFDPFEEDFAEKVKAVSGGGVKVAIEVTGVGAGLDGALDCMARFGRVALLGCTRDKSFEIDYYRKVHSPGITLVGAHTVARPMVESYPGYFTHRDDIKAVLKLCATGRLSIGDMVAEKHSPIDCQEVYTRLINDKNFPTVVQFDWSRLEK